MKVLFVHDGPLRKDSGGNYYGLAHNNDLFKRYKVIADEVGALIRVKPISQDEINTMSKLTLPNFSVTEVPDFNSLKNLLKNKSRADKVIKEAVADADYIIVRLHSTIGLQALKYARKLNKPYLIEVVGCAWDAYWNHSLTGKIIAPYMFFRIRNEVYKSKFTIYVTNKFLQERYPTKGQSVSCSNVLITDFNEQVVIDRMGRNNNTKIIGTTASVDIKYKGQQFVIEALGRLKKQGYTNFKYQLVGRGDSSYLKELAEKWDVKNEVEFLGGKPREKVLEWLDSIDLYVQPSRQEGLPRAVIEAMSRGLPAIGANTAGIPELLEEEYIFDRGKNNVKEIMQILKRLDKNKLKDQALRNYEESKKYKLENIEERRSLFLKCFKDSSL